MYLSTRSKGKLHQDGDGPTHDHNENTEGITDNTDGRGMLLLFVNTFNLSGYFLWTNAEFGKENDVAAISSPTVVAEESLCFNFWFDLTVRL